MSDNLVLREKTIDDIRNFTIFINKVWNETYRGIVDDEFIDNMSNNIEERIKIQTENFYDDNSYAYLLLKNNEIIGYVSVGKSRDDDYPLSGELFSLYLLKEYHGNGYGKLLFNYGLKKLKELGYDDFIIGCLDKNKTNDFYKYMGSCLYKQVDKNIGGKDYKENCYILKIK